MFHQVSQFWNTQHLTGCNIPFSGSLPELIPVLFGRIHGLQLISGIVLSTPFAVPDSMFPFTVVAHQLPLSSVGLKATLVTMGLTVMIPVVVILPIASTTVIL